MEVARCRVLDVSYKSFSASERSTLCYIMDIICKAAKTNRRPHLRRARTLKDPNESPFAPGPTESEKPRRRSTNSKGDWTCESDSYRYPIEESPKDPWERCYDVLDKSDDELCKDLKDEISYLLVVASLFLGIVTAFTIESFKWLRTDQEQAATNLLNQVVTLLNDTTKQGTAPGFPPFQPENWEIVVNQLWFLSMTLSLSAVVVGTLCLQWLAAFRRTHVKHMPHEDALALRQLRYEGLIGWGVPRVPAILLLTVQGALVLFAIGLLYLLWNVNQHVALPVAIVSGVSVALLTLTSLMPLLQSFMGWLLPKTLIVTQCPYKSPISWVTHRAFVLLALLFSLPLRWLPHFGKRVAEWQHQQLSLLTDYVWEKYDELWRKRRECFQSARMGTQKYSYYLVHGLASAMETLVFQPSAVHIIHTCLQEFHGTQEEVEAFEELFAKNFNEAEAVLLRSDYTTQAALAPIHMDRLRRDFLNSQALQHFVVHNKKLRRILLPHRVELYIRIKNSSQLLETLPHNPPNIQIPRRTKGYVGASMECPIQFLKDAQSLVHALKIQFLKCADQLIGTEHFQDEDAMGAIHVVLASQDDHSASGAQDDDDEDEEPSVEHRFKRVLTLLDARLSEPPQDDRSSIGHASSAGLSSTQGTVRLPSPIDHRDLFRSVLGKLNTYHPHVLEQVSPGTVPQTGGDYIDWTEKYTSQEQGEALLGVTVEKPPPVGSNQ
ncbi:hypothetical protein AN958_02966 [Leucoagaricus sp. SymC.cos]|nr:hypothetical protein AN958_02966 [Leucoagaricus sp. SymC.cos]